MIESYKDAVEHFAEERLADVKRIRAEVYAECHKLVQEAREAGEWDMRAIRNGLYGLQAKSAAMPIECRSGYHVATRADGSEYCEQDS